jgi:hypothetical protein
MATISDSGATCNCISNDVALELIEAGVTDRMHALDKPISIQFGVKSAKTPVEIIKGSGLIDDIYVVNNELPVMLISNTSLVDKGSSLCRIRHSDWVAAGRIVVVGIRDAATTSTASMWCLNLRALMQEPDPCCRDQEDSWQQQQSAEEIVAMILEHQSSNSTSDTRATIKLYQRSMGNHSNVLSEADFSVADIRRVRWLLKCLGVSPFTLAKTIELQAWRALSPG